MPSRKTGKPSAGFTTEERAAMKERVRELKMGRRDADGERDVLAAIARLSPPERTLCESLHKVIRNAAPQLLPKTWYGMPAYATPDEKVVVFFKPASKFKDRYLTLGFSDAAKLDDGAMWPTSYALTKLTGAEAKRIHGLIEKAIGRTG